MLNKIISRLTDTHKLYTAVQFGIDFDISKHLRSEFKHFDLFDVESELSNKFKEQFNFRDSKLIEIEKPKLLLSSFEYLEACYDFAYIHNRFSPDISGNLLNVLIRDETPFILCHPSGLDKEHPRYKRITFKSEEGDYKLYYNDLTFLRVNELFDV